MQWIARHDGVALPGDDEATERDGPRAPTLATLIQNEIERTPGGTKAEDLRWARRAADEARTAIQADGGEWTDEEIEADDARQRERAETAAEVMAEGDTWEASREWHTGLLEIGAMAGLGTFGAVVADRLAGRALRAATETGRERARQGVGIALAEGAPVHRAVLEGGTSAYARAKDRITANGVGRALLDSMRYYAGAPPEGA